MAKKLKKFKQLENLKKGMADLKNVLQEGNLKLFVKQVIVVLVAFLLLNYLTGQNKAQIEEYNNQMEAIRTQESSEQEYQKNKQQLLSLEPQFPDIANKNEWLLSQVLGVFKTANLVPQVSGQQAEDASSPTYVVATIEVNTEAGFNQLGKFLADVENQEEFLKVSDVSLRKDPSTDAIGNNQITMRFNTIFPKEKIASSMFKDYDKIMEQRKAQQNGGEKHD